MEISMLNLIKGRSQADKASGFDPPIVGSIPTVPANGFPA